MVVNGQCLADGTTGGGGAGPDAAGGESGSGLGGSSAGGGAGAAGIEAGVAFEAGDARSALDFCAGRDVLATGSPGLIDDFEDKDVRELANDGRSGDWELHGDGNGCVTSPVPLLPESPLAGMSVMNASTNAMNVTGTGCTKVHLGTAFNGYGDGVNGGACAYDASAYDGMYFWAMGPGVRLRAQVGLRTTISIKIGGDGTCAKDAMDNGCYDMHGFPFVLTADWKMYSFTWSQLRQEGWGTKATWDPKVTTEIGFAGTSNDASVSKVEFSVDNVGFFKGTPPTDPPMPKQ
jgi:hypothetical protein